MSEVVVIGNSNTDLVCHSNRLPHPGETVTGTSFDVHAGGKGANQAVAAARAGAMVRFIGSVGRDSYGEQRLNDLVEAGVNIDAVQRVDVVHSGIAMIVVDRAGENQIVVAPGANEHLSISQVDSVLASLTADSVVCLTLEAPEAVIRYIALEAAGRHRVVCNAAPYAEFVTDLANDVDLIILNEIETSGLLGYNVTPARSSDAVAKIQRLGFKQAVITLGDDGAAFGDLGHRGSVPALVADVVDTTGAGDAFCGVLAAWLVEGATLEAAVRAGSAAGALAVSAAGAQQSMPVRERILERLAEYGD